MVNSFILEFYFKLRYVFLSFVFVFLLFFFLSNPSYSNTTNLENQNESYYLDNNVEFLEDKEKNMTIEKVSSSEYTHKFKSSNKKIVNLGYSKSVYWVKFNLKNNTDYRRWILDVAFPRLNDVELYIPNNKSFIIKKGGSSYPYELRDIKIRNIAFEIIVNKKETFYLRVESPYSSVQIPLIVHSPISLIEKNTREEIFFNVCFGILMMSIIFYFIIFYYLKDFSYLYYSLFSLSLFLQQFSISGHGYYLLWTNYPFFNSISPWFFAFFAHIGSALFLIEINKIKRNTFLYNMVLSLPFLGFFQLITLMFRFDLIYSVISIIVMIVFIFTIATYFYKKRETYVKLISYAWLGLVFSYLIFIFNRMGIIQKNFLTDNLLIISACISNLIVSVALIKKYEIERNQKNDYYNQLETANKELANYKEHLEDLVSDKTKELLASSKEAEKVASLKSEFLATMSHEIRTPMNAVIGMSDLLSLTKLNEEQNYFVETIKSSGNVLMGIINDILDFSKIESGKMELEEKEFYLESCIEDVIDLFALKINEKNLDLFYVISEDVPDILISDVIRLKQILINLVSNAIKFTDKGSIYIYVELLDKKDKIFDLKFSIYDTGIGIKEDKKNRLFKSFSQADSSTNRKFGGTGLGLTISKKLSNLFHGDLNFKSNVPNGTVFYFNIISLGKYETSISSRKIFILNKDVYINSNNEDFKKVLLAYCNKANIVISEKIQDDTIIITDLDNASFDYNEKPNNIFIGTLSSLKNRNIDETNNNLIFKPFKYSDFINTLNQIENKNESLPKQSLLEQSNNLIDFDLASKYLFKILVAEDNLVNQKLIDKVFKKLGYSIDIKANGLEAVEAVKNKKYDLVFMDIQMPEMDGLEASKEIKRLFGDKSPKIIALTANVLEEDKDKYLQSGMEYCIGKPFRLNDIKNIIQKIAEG
jgi:signal transduction histidine kinase/CheY-like chemotaxis protein